MAAKKKSRFWSTCRICFRRFRITVLLVIFLLVAAVAYLNQIGLPDFIKARLLDRLRARGVELEFTRLRLLWHRGLVAENVQFGRAHENAGPKLTAAEVDLGLNYAALARFQFQVNSLDLRRGNFQWPLVETNQSARALVVSNIEVRLRFLTNDLWTLNDFRAGLAGARIRLTAAVTNATAIRHWPLLRSQAPAQPGALQKRLRTLVNTLAQVHFAVPPQLDLEARGDARAPQSFDLIMSLATRGANTPWGKAQEAQLTAHLFPDAHATNLLRGRFRLLARQVATRWATASNAVFTAEWTQALTNPVPRSGRGELTLNGARSQWGDLRAGRLTAVLVPPPTNSMPSGDASWAWWTNLAPYALNYDCQLAGLKMPKLAADRIFCAGRWRAPEFTIGDLSASLYDGALRAHARVNVASREFRFGGSSAFDPHKISPLLTGMARHWLAQFSWKKPPVLEAEGSLVLPAWTNRHPAWRDQVRPTVRLQGHFRVENGAYRGVTATAAESDFLYTNLVWYLPDLRVSRPEGQLNLVHHSSDATHDYYWRVQSTMDVRALRPLLEPREQRDLDLVTFSRPPSIHGEIWGRWHEVERTGARLWVAATNFTFRGRAISNFFSQLDYTNHVLKMIAPHAARGAETADAALVAFDFDQQTVFLTNGWSTADPQLVADLIGPQTSHDFKPYQFLEPPKVRVNGTIPLHGNHHANVVFDVDGGRFHWWKFNLPGIAGQVHWLEDTLALNHVRAAFYGGTATGQAAFDFSAGEGADFHFSAAVTNANLRWLMADLDTRTNKLEGTLNGMLVVTSANTEHWESWQGYGRARLRNGLVWEIPIFGILSPALDSIVPGLGNSRVTEGSASFTLTNSVIHSDNLELRSPVMRLQYQGNVDFSGRVNARVEAELLRDMWVVGRAVSAVLWPVSKLFEYQITGTLAAPRTQPVYVLPRLLSIPLHPFRTLKDLLPPIPGLTTTNSPANSP